MMMMSFCKKSVQTFLSLSHSKDNGTVPLDYSSVTAATRHSRSITPPSSSAAAGLTFFTLSDNKQRPVNVVESSALKSPPSSSSLTVASTTTTATTIESKRDPGGIGFLDEVGGNVDGLMSCTESLGFESSEERRVDIDKTVVEDVIMNHGGGGGEEDVTYCSNKMSMAKSKSKMMRKMATSRTEKKSFPPSLSSLNKNGKPNFYLQPVRRDGRLELMEVEINHRPEILQASRGDGRLRLNFICEDHHHEQQKEGEGEGEIIQENDHEEVEKKIEEREGWRLPASNSGSSGGDGLRRCHELIGSRHGHGHRHDLNVRRPHCVTIR